MPRVIKNTGRWVRNRFVYGAHGEGILNHATKIIVGLYDDLSKTTRLLDDSRAVHQGAVAAANKALESGRVDEMQRALSAIANDCSGMALSIRALLKTPTTGSGPGGMRRDGAGGAGQQGMPLPASSPTIPPVPHPREAVSSGPTIPPDGIRPARTQETVRANP